MADEQVDEMADEQVDEMVGVQVNVDTCIGAGQCEMLEEETFYLDEDTVIAGVIGTGMLPRERAQRVVDTCPSRAISIVESSIVESSIVESPVAEEE